MCQCKDGLFLKIFTNNLCKYSRHFTEVSLNIDPQPLITQICKNIEHVEFTSNFDILIKIIKMSTNEEEKNGIEI